MTTLKEIANFQRFSEQICLAQNSYQFFFECFDLKLNQKVYLQVFDIKIFQINDLSNFYQQLNTLKKINIEHFTNVIEFFQNKEKLYVVLEFCPGIIYEKYVEKNGPLSLAQAISFSKEILSVLQIFHQHKIYHQNLNPSFVLINDKKKINQPHSLHLISLAPGNFNKLESVPNDLFLQSISYMSPEQIGLINQKISAVSDIYSLGALIFYSLTKIHPYTSDHFNEILRKHLSTELPPIHSISPHIPLFVDEILARMTQKDRFNRYQTAKGVIADFNQLENLLISKTTESTFVVGTEDSRNFLTHSSFVGREKELSQLTEKMQQTQLGQGSLVLVEAESGAGKSRFLEEFIKRYIPSNTITLRGRGLEIGVKSSLPPLNDIIENIISIAEHDTELKNQLCSNLGPDLTFVLKMFSQLNKILTFNKDENKESEDNYSEAHGEVRNLRAVCKFLQSLGNKDRPCVIVFEDLQWATDFTLKLLSYWSTHLSSTVPCYVLLVGSFRSEEIKQEHLLRQLRPILHLKLPPFNEEQIKLMLTSMAGQLPLSIIQTISSLSKGNCFLAGEILHSLVGTAALKFINGKWAIENSSIKEIQSSPKTGILLARRIDILPLQVQNILGMAAILGKSFDLKLLLPLSNDDHQSVISALEQAQRAHLIWPGSKHEEFVFVHDKIRESILLNYPENKKQQLHLQAAKIIELNNPQQIYDLAFHYEAAKDYARALPYALKAARESRSIFALEMAEFYYEIAYQGAQLVSTESIPTIMEELADTFVLRTKHEQAIEKFKALISSTELPIDLARYKIKLGEVYFKQGELVLAAKYIEASLTHLGEKIPKKSTAFAVELMKQIFLQVYQSCIGHKFKRKKNIQHDTKALLALRCYWILCYIWWFSRRRSQVLWLHLRHLNYAQQFAPSTSLALAYSNHALILTTLPWLKRALKYAKLAVDISDLKSPLDTKGITRHIYSMALLADVQIDLARSVAHQSATYLYQAGNLWEMNDAKLIEGCALYAQGRLSEALLCGQEIYQCGEEIGEPIPKAHSLHLWSLASQGNLPDIMIEKELQQIDKYPLQTQIHLYNAYGIKLLLHKKDTLAAIEAFEKGTAILCAHNFRNDYVIFAPIWLVSALRTYLEELGPYQNIQRNKILKRTKKAWKFAFSLARKYQRYLALVWREGAMISALEGKNKKAIGLIEKSIDFAKKTQSPYEHALSLLVRGKLALLGPEQAEQDLINAKTLINEMDKKIDLLYEEKNTLTISHPTNLSLMARFDLVLHANKQIIEEAYSAERIFEAVKTNAQKLFKTEKTLFIPYTSETMDLLEMSKVIVSSGDNEKIDPLLVENSFKERRPLYFHNTENAQGNLGSAMCAPIFFKGKPHSFLYFIQKQIKNLFTEEDVRLAQFLTTTTSAALEMADGMARAKTELQRRDEFLAVASHELKTPLTAIELQNEYFIHQIKNNNWNEKNLLKLKKMAIIANTQIKKLSKMIHDLLEVASFRSGQIILLPSSQDLVKIIHAAIAEVSHELMLSKSTIELKLPSDIAGVWDPVKLQQVISNLLSNAIKYGQGRPIIISAKEISTKKVQLIIQDFGIGIQVKDRERIFDPFERIVSLHHYGGLGLGLYMAKQIIEGHGGRIWTQQQDIQGISFIIELDKNPTIFEKNR